MVWNQTAAAFGAILNAPTKLDWREDAYKELLRSDAARRLAKNVDTVHDFLAELADETLVLQLARYILFRCEFAVSTTSDQSLAVQVFRSQTGRGKDLQPSDILKAELVAALPEAECDGFAARWQAMEETLGREELQTFLVDLAQLAARVPLAGWRVARLRLQHAVRADGEIEERTTDE